ncbi:chymotrypsin-1-like [Sabethes cyaneus]|uniref:chymotrypsin-1-like n=1 Tax=Sabethes cyaneus TaxID=53552 RepID=UPI00237D59EF|nr:chymotrypsin-1-like [Sabethes cyaneus]
MYLRLLCVVLLYNFTTADMSSLFHIINETDASIEDFPFVISLRKNDKHMCGGSILTENWILTAAHCFNKLNGSVASVSVQVGRTNISREVDSSVHKVDQLVVHPEYSKEATWLNDIALIKLKDPLVFTELIQPVKLPPVGYEIEDPNRPVTVIGWGRIAGGKHPQTLQKLSYLIVAYNECNRLYNNSILPIHICTPYPGPYKGDSGGPLLYQGLQVGIVQGGSKPLPAVFTKVSSYIGFIKDYI